MNKEDLKKFEVPTEVEDEVLFEFARLNTLIRQVKTTDFNYDDFIVAPASRKIENTAVQSSNSSAQPESDAIAITEIKRATEEKKKKVEALTTALNDAIDTSLNTSNNLSSRNRIKCALRSNLCDGIPANYISISKRTLWKYRRIAIYFAAVNLGLIEKNEE